MRLTQRPNLLLATLIALGVMPDLPPPRKREGDDRPLDPRPDLRREGGDVKPAIVAHASVALGVDQGKMLAELREAVGYVAQPAQGTSGKARQARPTLTAEERTAKREGRKARSRGKARRGW